MQRGEDVSMAEQQAIKDAEQWNAWHAYLAQARPTLAELRDIRDDCMADDMDIEVDDLGRVVGRLGLLTRAQARAFFESGGDWSAAEQEGEEEHTRFLLGPSVPAGFLDD